MNESSSAAPASTPTPAWTLLAILVAGVVGGFAVGIASGVVFTGFEWADAVYAEDTGANNSSERFRLGVIILFGLTAAVISALVLRSILPRLAGLVISFEGAMAAMVAGSIVAAGVSSFLLLVLGSADSAVFSPWQRLEALTISFSLLALAVEYAVVRIAARPMHAPPESSRRGSTVSVAILACGVILVAAVVLVSGRDSVSRVEAPRPIQTTYFTQVRGAEQSLIQTYASLWAAVGHSGELEFRGQVLDAERALRWQAERLEAVGSPNADLDATHAVFIDALGTFADALFLVRDRELNGGDPGAKLSEAALVSELDEALGLLAAAGFEVDQRAWIVARGEPLDSQVPTEPGSPVGAEPPPRLATSREPRPKVAPHRRSLSSARVSRE